MLTDKTGVHRRTARDNGDVVAFRKDGVVHLLAAEIRLAVLDAAFNRLGNHLGLLHNFLFHIERIALLAAVFDVPVKRQNLRLYGVALEIVTSMLSLVRCAIVSSGSTKYFSLYSPMAIISEAM